MKPSALRHLVYLIICLTIVSVTGCASSEQPGADNDPPVDDPQDTSIAREIEEADIVKLQDGFLYLANPFTGLRIIDVSDIERPTMQGGVQLGGRGVELFVRDNLAFVLTAADFFFCAGEPVGMEAETFAGQLAPDFDGSRLWIVDVGDPAAPTVVTMFDFDGFVTATRRVGDVIYAAGNLTPQHGILSEDSGVFVSSINIADPDHVSLVDSETFPGDTLDIHVSTDALFIVGNDPQLSDTTLVSYVDIADPAGDIVPRDQFRVPGLVENRFFVDAFEDTFRIITDERIASDFVFTRSVALYTYDVSDPDNVDRLARLPIVSDESLRAVRFDGPRAYAVTFRFIDPLFVLDLSDPSSPAITGELKVPGFSTHLVPLGDRLIGVGFDDTAGFRPAVAMYDVSDPSAPRLLTRVILGEEFSFDTDSQATVDEKALRVIKDGGLILLPFSTFDFEVGQFIDALQLIGMGDERLTRHGTMEHNGLVRRANLLDERVWILSDTAFQTIDIDDLDAPRSLGNIEIISDQELLDAGLTNCADSARFRGTSLGGFFPGFIGPCGVFGLIPAFVTPLGLVMFRLIHRRRRRCA